MAVLPVPSVVTAHQPWPSDRISALSDRNALARAAALLGLPAAHLPLPLQWGPGPAQVAALRAVAEILLTRLEQTWGACPDCEETEQELDCARELGRLEARLMALANDAKLVLSWMEESPAIP